MTIFPSHVFILFLLIYNTTVINLAFSLQILRTNHSTRNGYMSAQDWIDDWRYGRGANISVQIEDIKSADKIYLATSNEYKEARNVFSELIPTCTIYFYGEYKEKQHPLLLYLYDICASTYSQSWDNCVQLITSKYVEDYIWEWTDFNFYHTRNNITAFGPEYINNPNSTGACHNRRGQSSRPTPQQPPPYLKPLGKGWDKEGTEPFYYIFSRKRHQLHCLVLIRAVETFDPRQPRWRTRGLEGEVLTSDYVQMPYNGRINPQFIFIFYKDHCIYESNNYCSTPWSNVETTGTSIILIISAKTNNTKDTNKTMLMYRLNRYPISIPSVDCTVEKIKSIWNAHHGTVLILNETVRYENSSSTIQNSSRFNEGSVLGNWKKLNENVCGGTPYVRRYIHFKRDDTPLRIWDPQEDCVYETILSKYIHGDTKRAFLPQWPFTAEFASVRTSNERKEDSYGKRGKYFLPVSGRFQGFRYSIFIDRKSIKTEFDMTSLLRPFDRQVWTQFMLTIVTLSVLLKFWSKSTQLFWLLATLLEQGELKTKLRISLKVCLLAIFWQLATVQLRLSYTGNMFSAITAERIPPTPEKMKHLFEEKNSKKFSIFAQVNEMETLISKGWEENKDYITGVQILSLVKSLDTSKLREWLELEKKSVSLFSIPKSMQVESLRIALIAYTHPYKLQISQLPRWPGEITSKMWQPPYPFDTVLVIFGQRLWIKNTDDPIRRELWLYQGKQNFFSHKFERDLSALVESGLYARWEAITCKITEAKYLRDETTNMDFNPTWNLYSAACRERSEKLKPLMTFRPVSNASIKVIWVLLLLCVGVCTLGYLQEVVTLDIPGRPCKCGAVNKYKRE